MKRFGKSSLLMFLSVSLMGLGIGVLTREKNAHHAGEIEKTNLLLDNVAFEKTGEVAVIPKHTKITIRSSDDSNWNSIVSESAPEVWRGVFKKNRKVTLGSFCMAQYPVTQELFTKIMGYNPCFFKKENMNIKYSYDCLDENPDLRPADTISWFDAIVFCNLLTTRIMGIEDCVYYTDSSCTNVYTGENAKRGIKPTFNKTKKGYRLPTEAEWEFAARGGNVQNESWFYPFSGTRSADNHLVYDSRQHVFTDSNLDNYGWYKGNSNGVTHEVGKKLPNRLGLYDMSGGIWEWLFDWYDATVYEENVTDPSGAREGTDRVLRGGSWADEAYESCVTRRFHNAHPYIPHYFFGFRYCRSF